MADENIDEKIDKSEKVKIDLTEEEQEGLSALFGSEGEEKTSEPEENEKVLPPPDLTKQLKETVYDTSPLTGFEDGEVSGIEGDVEITDSDKEMFLKAVLNDESVILDIPFCNGGIVFKVRSKTSWEQTLAYEATVQSRLNEKELDYYQSLLQLQKYGATLQILAINGTPMANLKYNEPGDDWQKQVDELLSASKKYIESIDSAKSSLILNALRLFEYKVAKMSAACNTADFWKPVG
jgi:hypothetical protein